MKKLIAILLAGLFIAGILAGCGDSPKKDDGKAQKNESTESKTETAAAETETETEKPDLSVKGKWILTSETVKRRREKYTSTETTGTYTVDLYEHRYEHKYTPDPEDPSDGPTPYSAAFDCECMIPSTLKPGDTVRFTLIATVDYDENPGSSDGMCCSLDFSGLTPEPKINSKHGYDYSDLMYYPVRAGSTIEYGNADSAAYVDGMTDYIDVTLPVITNDMNPAAYKTLTVTFMSNAGDSEFVYTWTAD